MKNKTTFRKCIFPRPFLEKLTENLRKKQHKHQEQKFHKETCRKRIINILPKVLNYDIAILSIAIHLKDDNKFCEIDI